MPQTQPLSALWDTAVNGDDTGARPPLSTHAPLGGVVDDGGAPLSSASLGECRQCSPPAKSPTEGESREARLKRLLGGGLRNVIRQASHATFTKRAHQQATEIAKRNNEGQKS